MEHSKIRDERRFKLDNILKKDYIPLFSGRPNRENIIGKEDEINLEIALNTAHSFEEFLAVV